MDPNICIRELERIVETGSAYIGPHSDPLAHAYGVASVLRDIASTDVQREKIAAAVAEIKSWYKTKQVSSKESVASERKAIAAIVDLKRAFG
jgi:hypothetical protein